MFLLLLLMHFAIFVFVIKSTILLQLNFFITNVVSFALKIFKNYTFVFVVKKGCEFCIILELLVFLIANG
jgi:hypothetical protein